jgi:hypothetical protein
MLSAEKLLGNRYVLIAVAACAALQMVFVYAGPLQDVFGSTHLTLGEWSRVLLVGAMVFVVAELEKAVLRSLGLFRGRGSEAAA